MKRARAGWTRVIGGTILSELQVLDFFFLYLGDRIENDEQSDDHYEGQNDGNPLAHLRSVFGL